MLELDECLEVARKIKDIEDDILELESRTMSPKNQIITNMPKGGGSQDSGQDRYLIKLEKLQARKNYWCATLNSKWNIAKLALINHANVKDTRTFELLKLRFYYGYPWKKCAARMSEKHSTENWNINKCFRVYRSVLYKNDHKY